jgi:hypothetical protein
MKSKIREVTGERIGQLIYNSIENELFSKNISTSPTIVHDVADKLYFIEDDELIKIVQDYIRMANK